MAMTTNQDIIFTGDIKRDFLRPKSILSKYLKEIISTYSLNQQREEATRVTEESSALSGIAKIRKPKKAGALYCSLSDHSFGILFLP